MLATFFLYIKIITSNTDNDPNIQNENQELIADELVNQSLSEKKIIENALRYKQSIEADLLKQVKGLGDNGHAASLTNASSKQIGELQLKKIALNEELSEHLSYSRTLQDARNPLCLLENVNLSGLPSTSIVIIFYNEPYSVLVRTIHSVLNTVDYRLLKEIILVDDSSTNDVLRGKLDHYIHTKLPVNIAKIIRLKHRYVSTFYFDQCE